MSIADISNERLGGAPERGNERTPPHDLLAEQSTLGGMLLSPDAVADVVESIRGTDFYVPKHELIFEAILSLYSHGEPTDVVAVTDELIKTGDLMRAGGADYLHSLTSIVPTAANSAYYASIVRERALLRRLVEAGTRIVQMGYASEGEVVDLVEVHDPALAGGQILGMIDGLNAHSLVGWAAGEDDLLPRAVEAMLGLPPGALSERGGD